MGMTKLVTELEHSSKVRDALYELDMQVIVETLQGISTKYGIIINYASTLHEGYSAEAQNELFDVQAWVTSFGADVDLYELDPFFPGR